LLRGLDRRHRLDLLPFQAPGACGSLGLSPEECESAAWAVGETGRPVRGAEAILLGLSAVTGVARLSHWYHTPWLQRGADGIYAWIAQHRGRLPGVRPYCKARPAACGRRADPDNGS
jgi:predicted DCC family thiol-disulfide oxidoreductase YuxK